MAGMIIVNTPGTWSHVYAPLRHASWHGATPTDLVFPFFLFIVGVSIALAFDRQISAGKERPAMVKKLAVRALKIFLLGLLLTLFPYFDFANIRIPGVLQRISLVFLACGFLYLYTDWKSQAKWGILLLLGYWIVMGFIPVPVDDVIAMALQTGETMRAGGAVQVEGIRALGEGWIAANYEPGTNMQSWFDRMIVPGRFYEKTWDPEGFLSTFPAIGTGIAGMLTGKLILSKLSTEKKVVWMFFAGFASFVAGAIWDWFFPINKHIWTSSYVLHTAGLAAMALAFFIWLVDVQGKKKWTYMGVVFGSNAVVAYVLHGILLKIMSLIGLPLRTWFYEGLVSAGMPEKMSSLTWALFYSLVICYLPVWWLYRKKIFIKL